MPPPGIEPATSCFPACHSYKSAVGTVKSSFYGTINQHVWQCMFEIDFGQMCIGTVRQYLHLFYQYRCYLLITV